jgi:hypothetical protein
MYNGYRVFPGGKLRPVRDADPSPLIVPRSKIERSYTSTLPKGLCGLWRSETYLKQVFQSVYRHELETKLSQKPWKQEIAKIPDWPRRKAVAEFRLCVGHDCLGTHLHRIGTRPDPNCMLCSLHEPMDRNHLGQCTALSNGTECERYWEARTKMMEN